MFDNLPKAEGSSPLTRGKLGRHRDGIQDRGLIPAHAGKTRDSVTGTGRLRAHPRSRGENYVYPFRTRRAGAHPRSRGENVVTACLPAFARGSSPLTRGKLSAFGGDGPSMRLIPAHAGKTVRSAAVLALIRAHPRSRGENAGKQQRTSRLRGSSPLTRGKQRREGGGRAAGGLIPAHAGKTRLSNSSSCQGRAHPRSRGENRFLSSLDTRQQGSSPLTRGKLRDERRAVLRDGLIPAHAGKTFAPSTSTHVSRAHPRSRGENLRTQPTRWARSGSSPLTRGKLTTTSDRPSRAGLIPAHAGKTVKYPPETSNFWAHPRSRGENDSYVV